MVTSQRRWAIFIVGNAAIAVLAWLTAPLLLGERPPFWMWAIVAAAVVAVSAVPAARRR